MVLKIAPDGVIGMKPIMAYNHIIYNCVYTVNRVSEVFVVEMS